MFDLGASIQQQPEAALVGLEQLSAGIGGGFWGPARVGRLAGVREEKERRLNDKSFRKALVVGFCTRVVNSYSKYIVYWGVSIIKHFDHVRLFAADIGISYKDTIWNLDTGVQSVNKMGEDSQ